MPIKFSNEQRIFGLSGDLTSKAKDLMLIRKFVRRMKGSKLKIAHGQSFEKAVNLGLYSGESYFFALFRLVLRRNIHGTAYRGQDRKRDQFCCKFYEKFGGICTKKKNWSL